MKVTDRTKRDGQIRKKVARRVETYNNNTLSRKDLRDQDLNSSKRPATETSRAVTKIMELNQLKKQLHLNHQLWEELVVQLTELLKS